MAFIVSAWPLPGANVKAPAEVASNQTSSRVGTTLTDASIITFATMAKAQSPAAFVVNPTIVKDLFVGFTRSTAPSAQYLKQALKTATPADVSAALALKRCAIVGVPPKECQ
ncbi:hypothetical protein [Burkholderia stagnalis]|uniref:hypothetical protein n=1 Tax=Burkholderia stagnalis TaxID=1503054 RepID=UPI0012DA6EA3|nr:hypothetical protein [Burkholderia stagnalis]